MHEKYQMKSERAEISVCGFECCMFWMQKMSWVETSLENWNVFVTYEFSSETLVLWKRWSSLYTKCIQVLRNPLNFCAHLMWVKWWHHAKFQSFLSSGYSPFQFQGHLAENKSLNAWNSKWSQKGLKFQYVVLNVACWMQKSFELK